MSSSPTIMNATSRFGAPVQERLNPNAKAGQLRRRQLAERAFRTMGFGAIAISLTALCVLLGSVASKGWRGFLEPVITLEIDYSIDRLNPDALEMEEALSQANYGKLASSALQEIFPDVRSRRSKRALKRLVSSGAEFTLRDRLLEDRALLGRRVPIPLPLSDDAARWLKGGISEQIPEDQRPLSDAQLAWLGTLRDQGLLSKRFNLNFLTSGDSREPELAGVYGSLVGSILTLLVTLACSFPIGVGAAIYLEEFAKQGRLSDFIEININNLAAVPSLVFGLLGLSLFLNFFGLPRSAPLVGGLVLSLMTLPTIIIATRSALKSVPPSIREAAMAVGASPIQVVVHHLLPLAMPGIMTGTIVGMARALGETAPLLMIGMVAFVADIPDGFSSPSTVLPVQIYLWSDSPQRGFEEKTSAAILVLLAVLIAMNAAAIIIRRRFEQRW